ncbi:MAG: hypothetical protein DRQ10_08410 [Candidatus Hydrothermota bacterium]|nr:MAG: hypothetical protein DRQ10_08410 [Candidatus Hydrothermae bacterium]
MLEEKHIEELKIQLRKAKPWIRFAGIGLIILGIISAISIVGVVWAWGLIWMGINLIFIANRIDDFLYMDAPQSLVEIARKIKNYFLIQSIVTIIWFIFMVVYALFLLHHASTDLNYFPD